MTNKKPAYLVLGVEGSGTRMLTQIMIAAGAKGDGGHGQAFDKELPEEETLDRPIVWRRSMPHAGKTPDISVMAHELRRAGWEPYGLIIVRDTVANVRAQVPAHAPGIHEAWEKNQQQFALMFMGIRGAFIPYDVFTYENIVARPKDMQDYIGSLPGLHSPDPYLDIKDANEKHWATWRRRPVE